jgi:hypothetical protein
MFQEAGFLQSLEMRTYADARDTLTRDRRWALRMMADGLNISRETILQILHETLRKGKISSKFVPDRLTDEQNQRRLTSCYDFIQTFQDNPHFHCCNFSFLR